MDRPKFFIPKYLLPLAAALLIPCGRLDAEEPAVDPSTQIEEGLEVIENDARLQRLLRQAADAVAAQNFEEALALTDEAIVISPDSADALNTRGAALLHLKRFDEGREVLQRAVENAPDAFAPNFNLAEIYFLQGDYAEAAFNFRVLAGRFGATPLLKFKLVISYLLAGYPEQARTVLRDIRFPADGPGWYFAHAAMSASEGGRAKAKRLSHTATVIHGEEARLYEQALIDSGLLK